MSSFFRNNLIPFATDSTIQSYVGMTNIGSSGGIAYQPGVCGSMRYRTAVIRSYSDQTTGEVSSFWSPTLDARKEAARHYKLSTKDLPLGQLPHSTNLFVLNKLQGTRPGNSPGKNYIEYFPSNRSLPMSLATISA